MTTKRKIVSILICSALAIILWGGLALLVTNIAITSSQNTETICIPDSQEYDLPDQFHI